MGQEQLNQYAIALRAMGPLLWVIRAFLIIWFLLHVWTGIKLWLENKRARPIGYKFKDHVQSTLSSRFMIWTGLALFAFVVYHLLHFTFVVTNPHYEHLTWQGHLDVYSMVILGFQNYIIAGVYIVGMIFLGLHLRHAVNSMFQTMGWNNAKVQPKLDKLAIVYAWIIVIGYITIPVSVMLGLVKLPGGGM
jgi:succinate dehydrogenase / fumarate reductase cytochrome b subunit